MAKQCETVVQDYKNGTRYNLRRVLIVPKERQCKNKAKLGSVNCAMHQKALDERYKDFDGDKRYLGADDE